MEVTGAPTDMFALRERFAISILDQAGRILGTEPLFERILGYPPTQLTGQRFTRLIREGDAFRRLSHDLLAGTRDHFEFICHLVHRAGKVIPARLSARLTPQTQSPVPFVLVLLETPGEISGETLPEQVLDHVLDRIPDGFAVLDREWRFVYVNHAAEAYYRLTREQLVGKVVWEVFPASAGSEVERELRRAAAGRDPVVAELFSPSLLRWISYRVFPSDAGVSVYFCDITPRKQAELALRESESRYRSAFESSMDGILITAPTGEIFAANATACRMLGRSEEEIRKVGRAGLVDLRDPSAFRLIEERRQRGHARGELTLIRKDGTTFPAEVSSAIFSDANGEERTSLTFHDLTYRKRAEDALRLLAEAGESFAASLDYETTLKTLTRLIVPRLADFCAIDLVEGDVVHRVAIAHRDPSKESAVRALREGREGLLTQAGIEKVLRTREPEFVPEITDEWLRAASRDEAHREAIRALAPTSVVMVPLIEGSRAIGVLSLAYVDGGRRYDAATLDLARNLADRAALALQNARLYSAALEAKRLRDEMLGMVSHDLRNPLNTIALSARLLAKRGDAPELASILRAAARAERLIEDLLTTAMLEAGNLPLARRDESVGEIVHEVIELHRALAETSGISLEAHVEEGLPRVNVDRHRIVQLLSNLLGNALKFTSAGGRVTVTAARAGGELRLTVSDTGTGISPEEMAHLFDRFWQGRRARRSGAGLGLAIVKGIADAHRGAIRVSSEIGKGSSFTFALPLEPRRPPVGPPAHGG